MLFKQTLLTTLLLLGAWSTQALEVSVAPPSSTNNNYDAKINSLSSTIDLLIEKIDELTSVTTNIENDITNIKQNISNINTDITTIKTQVTNNTTNITNLTTTVNNITNTIVTEPETPSKLLWRSTGKTKSGFPGEPNPSPLVSLNTSCSKVGDKGYFNIQEKVCGSSCRYYYAYIAECAY